VFTRTIHWSLHWARSIQSVSPHPISLRSILILSTYLRLGLHSSLFPSGVRTNIIYTLLFSPFVLHAIPNSAFLTWSFYGTWRIVQVNWTNPSSRTMAAGSNHPLTEMSTRNLHVV
jgi:hypothetical protein